MNSRQILDKFDSLSILVIGDVMIDHYIQGDVARISPEAPVPVINVHKETFVLGGAANVAQNLRTLGVGVNLFGCIGDDQMGETMQGMLNSLQIGSEHSLVKKDSVTIVKTRVVARNQQLCRIDHEGPRRSYSVDVLSVKNCIDRAILESDAVIISDYAKGVITQEIYNYVVAACKNNDKFLAVDPKPTSGISYHGAGLMTPNRSEAIKMADLLEDDSPTNQEIAEIIFSKYQPKFCVITLGAEGAAIAIEGKIERTIPTKALEVFDVSGAGDTVISALTSAFLVSKDVFVAADFANLAAGVAVSKFGTSPVLPFEIIDLGDRQIG